MQEHDRVVIEVDHAGGRLDLLGDLVHVLRCGQSRADIQQLPDAHFADQVADHPAEYVTLGAHAHLDGGQRRDHLIADRPVSGEIVLSAQQVVIDPRDMRPRRIELCDGKLAVRHQPIVSEAAAAG